MKYDCPGKCSREKDCGDIVLSRALEKVMTLMMTSAQVVKTSVSPSQEYTHSDDHNLPTYDRFS